MPSGHAHCPTAPKRNGLKLIKPTRAELATIRRAEVGRVSSSPEPDAFHTPSSRNSVPSSNSKADQAPESLSPPSSNPVVILNPKRKGSVITEYKNRASAPSSPAPARSGSQRPIASAKPIKSGRVNKTPSSSTPATSSRRSERLTAAKIALQANKYSALDLEQFDELEAQKEKDSTNSLEEDDMNMILNN